MAYHEAGHAVVAYLLVERTYSLSPSAQRAIAAALIRIMPFWHPSEWLLPLQHQRLPEE
jgi:hypothetical protein